MTTGQQVKGGVAPHGVKGEGVHGTRVTSHVTHLVLSVGRHRDKYSGGLDDVSQNFLPFLLPRQEPLLSLKQTSAIQPLKAAGPSALTER